MKVLVLVDGEHYPPVVRAAIEHLPTLVAGAEVVGAVLLGGGEKLAGPLEVGLPVVHSLTEGLRRFQPGLVYDLSDEPVVDARSRLRLAAHTLLAGIAYQGADFRLEPPPRPRVATKPSIAVVGTGKRTGKTAVSAHLARSLDQPPVVVAMGRGGPPEPELIDPTAFDLSAAGLVRLAATGRHAASDHLEDALMAGVVTIGTRRCGGGLAGAPVDSTFEAGVRLANDRPEPILILEGSGAAVPPVHADVTLCVVPATADAELVTGYLGAYKLLLADLAVLTMAEPDQDAASSLEAAIAGVAPDLDVVRTTLRPRPVEDVSGASVYYVTTASERAGPALVAHLEARHGCTVVGRSHNLGRRQPLAADMAGGLGGAGVVLVELKAAAVDVVARIALERGLRVVFCDNEVVTTGAGRAFEERALALADLAVTRFGAGAGAASQR